MGTSTSPAPRNGSRSSDPEGQGYRPRMSESSAEGISDEQLPDDLVGSEDNPLAEEPEEQPDFDVREGKDAEETEDEAGDDASEPEPTDG